MAQFVAFDPAVEVRGAAILSTIEGLEADVRPLLERHGMSDVQPDAWYPQQAWLDVLKDISEARGEAVFDLVSIGMRIPDSAVWPAEVDSVESALKSIDVAYHMNHRNGEIGHYLAEIVGENHVRVTCDNPYPSDFDYGIIYRTAQKFMPEGMAATVWRADSPSRLEGDEMCIYDVTWR